MLVAFTRDNDEAWLHISMVADKGDAKPRTAWYRTAKGGHQ